MKIGNNEITHIENGIMFTPTGGFIPPMYDVETNNDFAKMLQIELIIKEKEIQRLHSIIKEARELLNQEWYSVLRKETITKVKEILDKVGDSSNDNNGSI